MKKRQYEIECGRCGETRLEFLTEGEARAIADGVGPAYRPCERCGKMTGWIEARGKRASIEGTRNYPTAQQSARNQAAEGSVPRGQERMATQSERDEVDEMLRRPEAVPIGGGDR